MPKYPTPKETTLDFGRLPAPEYFFCTCHTYEYVRNIFCNANRIKKIHHRTAKSISYRGRIQKNILILYTKYTWHYMRIWCNHTVAITDEMEHVCTKCGMVLDSTDEKAEPSSQSKANLYELREVGSRDTLPSMGFAASRNSGDVKRYFGGNLAKTRPLSEFSNMCEKLSLPLSVQEHAWRLYARAAMNGSCKSGAEHACWAVHTTCRVSGIPKSDTEIKSAAMLAYGRRRLPDMFTIAYRHMDVPGAGGSGSDTYFFNLNLRRMVSNLKMTDAEFASRKTQAWEMYNGVYTEGSCHVRARRAISAAFGVK